MVSQGRREAEKALWCLAQLLGKEILRRRPCEPWTCKILPFHYHQEPTEGTWCHHQLSLNAEHSLPNLPLGASPMPMLARTRRQPSYSTKAW